MELSIVIPAYNEEKRIGRTLQEYLFYFSKKYKDDVEVIVVLNGCRDNTMSVVERFKRYKQLRILEFKEGIGKGGAVIEGWKVARGNNIGFVDADNSTTAEEFDRIFRSIGYADAVIASRYMKGAVVEPKQPLSRRVASRGFNLLIRFLFGLKLADSQCGAKIFTKKVIEKILPKMGITRWAFDIDLLYQLKRQGFTWKEVPTVWKDTEGSKLNVKKATVEMFLAVTRLRLMYSPLRFVVKIYEKVF
ncbi:MAG TPA: dolichyl-phosphate beta-glucosyltransferase [Candidatus Nanoarchaeia archaeon]|nr:dolichyl-phosphate beta-glucosyltransferase [Candidatus Nanoarchaeia archaeon]